MSVCPPIRQRLKAKPLQESEAFPIDRAASLILVELVQSSFGTWLSLVQTQPNFCYVHRKSLKCTGIRPSYVHTYIRLCTLHLVPSLIFPSSPFLAYRRMFFRRQRQWIWNALPFSFGWIFSPAAIKLGLQPWRPVLTLKVTSNPSLISRVEQASRDTSNCQMSVRARERQGS